MAQNFSRAIERYLEGEPVAAIARDSGVPTPTLYNRLFRAGVPSRGRLRRERALNELPALAATLTAEAMAARYGVVPATIKRWAEAIGVELLRVPRPTPPRRVPPLAPQIIHRYRDGESPAVLADELGISRRVLGYRLRVAGVPPRARPARAVCVACGRPTSSRGGKCRDCARRYPLPAPRVCELAGCEIVFVPQAGKAARGAGRFSSYRCWNQWRSGRPQREWRP